MSRMESDPRYRFETLVVGANNRLAVAASRSVAQAPGSSYNPLFVYGASGLGKTHLLIAVGQLALQLHPELRVRYVPLDEWVDELHVAVATARMDAFKARYHEVDLLILDDVQFLAGRRESQSEMLRLFSLLHREGCQIVLASDRAPTEISDLDQRLLTRLSGGLVVDLDMPDYETRMAILQRKCVECDTRFEAGVIEAVARLSHGNIRELQGALTRLVAFQRLGDISVTPQNVSDMLGEHTAVKVSVPATANEFGNFLSDITVAVAQHVESWHARLGEAVTTWSQRGYRTASLERALSGQEVPDVDALLQIFAASVTRLQALQRKAAASDPALAGSQAFYDPERIAEAEALAALALGVPGKPPQPVAEFSRDTFETGSSNQFAVKAADAVARELGRRYNPLYIHGPPGTGKSHLVHSIGSEILASSGGAHSVAVLDAATFSQEFITAMQEGAIERWRTRYRALDLLVIDDVQNLAGRSGTQEEFFHLFNA
ncbi:MAG: DnaA ATPase domain-containing protein, partial [Gemmatimonadaceae bacterium]